MPNDTATITTATGSFSGTVTFTGYPTANCTGTAFYGPTGFPASGNASTPAVVSTANTTAFTADTDVSWLVVYVNTANDHGGSTSNCVETSNLDITQP